MSTWSLHQKIGLGGFALVGMLLTTGCVVMQARAEEKPAGAHPTKPDAKKKGTLTFARDIAPIVYNNCTSCHRAGEATPFVLQSYQDVKNHARTIEAVTQSHYMPPWKADSHGEFIGEHRLTTDQINTIHRWVTEGMAQGNPADLPSVPKFPTGWHLGKPDVILQPSQSYALAAAGDDVYRCFVIPTNTTEDRYLAGVEVHPGNGKVVHHVIAYLDTTGRARELDAKDPEPGYTSFGGPGFAPSGALGGWVPGYNDRFLPEGSGTLLPKGADVVLQVHYHKSGKPETDLTKIGLYYCKTPVDKRVRWLPVIEPFLNIPAGEAHYEAKATTDIPANITVLDVLPHMHLLGRDMTVTAQLPDGAMQTLVKVPDWDFNWQMRYIYKQPVELPKGTKVNLVAHYDNSSSNPRNPTMPPKPVRWGEQTTDEMCIAFLTYTVDAEHLTKGVAIDDTPEFGRSVGKGILQRMFAQFDVDKDGALDAAELTKAIAYMREMRAEEGRGQSIANGDPAKLAQMLIKLLDKNGDHKLSVEEMSGFARMMRGHGGGKQAGGFGF